MGSPIPFIALFAAYLTFVLKIGPNFMRDREAFNLKAPIFLYNLFQIIASTAIVIKVKIV
jgi:GNS1/SUR4 family